MHQIPADLPRRSPAELERQARKAALLRGTPIRVPDDEPPTRLGEGREQLPINDRAVWLPNE